MIAHGIEIIEYLPQRPPVVMIDKLIFSDSEKTISGLHIDTANIFTCDGHFSESGLVENIAQTAAAGVGYICKIENRKVPVGFIASIRNLKIYNLPAVGTDITTETTVTNQVMGISILKGSVYQDGKLMAVCEMRIFVKPE